MPEELSYMTDEMTLALYICIALIAIFVLYFLLTIEDRFEIAKLKKELKKIRTQQEQFYIRTANNYSADGARYNEALESLRKENARLLRELKLKNDILRRARVQSWDKDKDLYASQLIGCITLNCQAEGE